MKDQGRSFGFFSFFILFNFLLQGTFMLLEIRVHSFLRNFLITQNPADKFGRAYDGDL